jgi:hypothetical protein
MALGGLNALNALNAHPPQRKSGHFRRPKTSTRSLRASEAQLTATSKRDFGIDRYLRPMDSSSRFCQSCIKESKRGTEWTAQVH